MYVRIYIFFLCRLMLIKSSLQSKGEHFINYNSIIKLSIFLTYVHDIFKFKNSNVYQHRHNEVLSNLSVYT